MTSVSEKRASAKERAMSDKNTAAVSGTAAAALIALAQDLQVKRENHMVVLEQLPMPKAKVRKFPYASMEAAIKDEFKLLDPTDGADTLQTAFRVMVKGWNTIQWRKAAEKNRETRDDIADGEVPVAKPKRVRKPKAVAAAEAPAA